MIMENFNENNLLDKLIPSGDSQVFLLKARELYEEGYNINGIIGTFKKFIRLKPYIKETNIAYLTFIEILDIIYCAENERKEIRSKLKETALDDCLVYDKDGYMVYFVSKYDKMKHLGSGCSWCINYNKKEYDMYAKQFDIYVVHNYNLDKTHNFHKTCLLLSDEVDMVVGRNNIHHYSDDKDYKEFIKEIYNEDIIKMFEL